MNSVENMYWNKLDMLADDCLLFKLRLEELKDDAAKEKLASKKAATTLASKKAATKTKGGLKKDDLVKIKRGKFEHRVHKTTGP